uniref:Uncharacterized protein n=1 Tax=Nothobranchius furzeri TaxID=105023 RepID=A0A8C6KMS2_NOTFU
ISPISKMDAIFDRGFSAASFSFLASKRGLYNKTGRRLTKEGTADWSSLDDFFFSGSFLSASHIFTFASGSGNVGSSGSTTMCFFSLVHPLSLPLRPFGFWVAFGREAGVAESITASLTMDGFMSVPVAGSAEAVVSSGCSVKHSTLLGVFEDSVFTTGGLISMAEEESRF